MLTSRFVDALLFAFNTHKNQTRKATTIPYFAHVMGVSSYVLEAGADEDTAIAALLHDAVEDGGGLPVFEQIRIRFGERVANIVDHCTDSFTQPRPPWRERKEKYLEKLATASPEARLVSVADKLYNVRSIIDALRLDGDSVWDRFNGGKDGSLWYYRSLLDIFQATGSNQIIDEYARAIALMEQLLL